MTSCSRCEGAGWEPVELDGRRRVRRCVCWLQANPASVANLPDYFKTATMANLQPTAGVAAAVPAANRWLKGAHDLYLEGPVGVGKSRLASSLANEAVSLGASAAFFDVSDLLDRARAFEFGDGTNPIPQARSVDILVLDDVGSGEKASNYTLRVLLGLYNHRLANSRRTILTSNLGLDSLSQWLQDDRLSSRIVGSAEVVVMSGDDYRLASRKPWKVPHG